MIIDPIIKARISRALLKDFPFGSRGYLSDAHEIVKSVIQKLNHWFIRDWSPIRIGLDIEKTERYGFGTVRHLIICTGDATTTVPAKLTRSLFWTDKKASFLEHKDAAIFVLDQILQEIALATKGECRPDAPAKVAE